MKTELIVNDKITLVVIPENDIEKELLKKLATQDNEVLEIRNATSVLNKTVNSGLVISRKEEKSIPTINAAEEKAV